MFTVAEAEAIRNAFNQGGEPGIRDNAKALESRADDRGPDGAAVVERRARVVCGRYASQLTPDAIRAFFSTAGSVPNVALPSLPWSVADTPKAASGGWTCFDGDWCHRGPKT